MLRSSAFQIFSSVFDGERRGEAKIQSARSGLERSEAQTKLTSDQNLDILKALMEVPRAAIFMLTARKPTSE